MRKRQLHTSTLTYFLLATILGVFATQSAAWAFQDAAKPKPAAPAKRAKARGRLPAFYGRVVNGEQREKIYAIQKGYQDEIASLVEKLAELRKKQRGEIEEVLTPEQLKKVQQIAEEAKARRAKPKPKALEK